MRRAAVALLPILVTAAALGLLYREALQHGFSAREEPWALEVWVARRLRSLATGADVRSLQNPLAKDAITLAEARDHFADHCAVCHANDGSGRTPVNAGLYPPAPDLREPASQALTDGELFRIIENGIRFTGMPGWGGSADENWALVLFLRHLPQLSEEELQLMREIHPDD
jgi:mono/diheme cytochrome c family protein